MSAKRKKKQAWQLSPKEQVKEQTAAPDPDMNMADSAPVQDAVYSASAETSTEFVPVEGSVGVALGQSKVRIWDMLAGGMAVGIIILVAFAQAC